MGAYFSFERMITTTFVKVIYFIGFLAITAGGVALAVWAGMQLNDARIDRVLGWRYVAAGVGLVVIGNLVWRVFCELWVVLFEIHSELVSVRYGLNLNGLRVREEPVEIVEREEISRPREVVVHNEAAQHHASVLGLS
ncbi:MAG TPA: DUF4282 domain-containing protein [Pyrinomonadaceae bacterium]|jgi:hypothetical protein|nr:DUF4282 domain-containing protein [Pyrinomonadaceae bacterium]